MPLVNFLILSALFGFLAWAITTFIPMSEKVKGIIIIATCAVLIVVFLQAMGLLPNDLMIPRVTGNK